MIILMLHYVSIVAAQNCYRETRKEAISVFGQKNFKRAKQIFSAASSCPDKPESNDLAYWINRCNKANNPKTQKKELSFAQKMSMYESDGEWSEGLMAVTKKKDWEYYDKLNDGDYDMYSKSPKVGFINTEGELVIPCQFLNSGLVPIEMIPYVNFFSEGLAVVSKYNEQGEYCSMEYIDKMGKPALSQDFALCKPFKEGIASVVYDSEAYYKGEPSWFFINKAGKDLFGTLYEMTGVFGDGMCSVMKDSVNGIGYINSNGELVIPYKYIYASTFENGFAVVGTKASGAKYAIINKKGEVISDYKFRPQYLSSSQIIDAIKNEINSQNYLTSFEMCKECEKIGVNDYINSYIANTLGRHFYHGWAVSKDLELANNYFRKAIELKQNHSASVNSYNYLGIICEEKKDFASAVRYYNLCIEKDKDYYPALYNLGMLYYYGHGVAQDYKMALSYFERCAKLGNKRNAEKMMEKCKIYM